VCVCVCVCVCRLPDIHLRALRQADLLVLQARRTSVQGTHSSRCIISERTLCKASRAVRVVLPPRGRRPLCRGPGLVGHSCSDIGGDVPAAGRTATVPGASIPAGFAGSFTANTCVGGIAHTYPYVEHCCFEMELALHNINGHPLFHRARGRTTSSLHSQHLRRRNCAHISLC
jgi:hypothetical protein